MIQKFDFTDAYRRVMTCPPFRARYASKSLVTVVMMIGSLVSSGQDISITFAGGGISTQIDSIAATNLRTGQRVTLPGNETLVLTANTAVPLVSEWTHTGNVFPNPFSGKATFSAVIQKPQTIYLSVKNLAGQVLAQTKAAVQSGEHEFFLSFVSSGIYLVSLTTEEGTSGYKIICTESGNPQNRIEYAGSRLNNPGTQPRPGQAGLKSYETGYSLGYLPGDVIHFRCMYGPYISIFTDSPLISMIYYAEFTDCADPDGKVYSTVNIGAQTWMAENLAYLPAVSRSSVGSATSPHYYVYGYQGTSIDTAKATGNYATYGVLYNWEAAMTACPAGWHLPSMAEWIEITYYLGTSAGGKMKETGTNHWEFPNTGATNASGFNSLPGGINSGSEFYSLGIIDFQWSNSLGYNSRFAYANLILKDYDTTMQGGYTLEQGLSVRCIKGEQPNIYPPQASFTISPFHGTTSTVFQFDASASTDAETRLSGLEVRWDWDGDGTWDTDYDKIKTKTYQFAHSGGYSVTLEVKDGGGFTATETTKLIVADGIFTDNRDGHEYTYRAIENQTWMLENLAFLPSVNPSSDGSETVPKYYVYGYEGTLVSAAQADANYITYGVLYNWDAARTACPAGWHLPSDGEWTILMDYLGADAGLKIKSTSGWTEYGNGDNWSGFTALPGGNRYFEGGFFRLGSYASFWSGTDAGSPFAWFRDLTSGFTGVGWYYNHRSHGFSVRCLKD